MELHAHIPRVVNPAARAVGVDEAAAVPDAVLVRRAAAGDEEAFTLLYHRHERDAWGLASFRLRDPHEAEEAVQETFVRAYRALGSFRGGDSARPWLLTICRNVCMDRLRTSLGRPTMALDDGDEHELAAPAADLEGRIDLHAALTALPPEDAEAFFLVDVLGCRSHEAARVVGLRAPSTLRSRLDRARRAIAGALTVEPAPAGEPHVWGLLHAPPERAIVVAQDAPALAAAPALTAGRAQVAAAAAAAGAPHRLVRFFEELERRIPADRRVLAVIGVPSRRCLEAADPWIAGHDRWRLRVAPTRDGWLRDAERLLTGDGRDRALARLRGAQAFEWTAES